MKPIFVKDNKLHFSLKLSCIYDQVETEYDLKSFLVEDGFIFICDEMSFGLKDIDINNKINLSKVKEKMFGLHVCFDNDNITTYCIRTGLVKEETELQHYRKVELLSTNTIKVISPKIPTNNINQVFLTAISLGSGFKNIFNIINKTIAINTTGYVSYSFEDLKNEYNKLRNL
jgi:hypothetical protein